MYLQGTWAKKTAQFFIAITLSTRNQFSIMMHYIKFAASPHRLPVPCVCRFPTVGPRDTLFQESVVPSVCILFVCFVAEGGFTEFKAKYPSLCTSSEMRCVADHHHHNHPHQSSLSQPCLPVSNVGPTRILPFLFLGSQLDAMSRETMLVGWTSTSA